MSWNFRFHKQVSNDISKSTSWYEKQRSGLGEAFYTEARMTLLRIQANPAIHGFIKGTIRFTRLHRFPFAIYFSLQNDTILVLGIRHTSQDIKPIINRMKNN